ncbi:MAG: hypothetical protein WBI29_00925 [Candidatus Saccharimonadales bacterium]
MSGLQSLSIIFLAALIHASFQLSVSVLTLISGHSLSAKYSNKRALSLASSFILGVILMIFLLLSSLSWVFMQIFQGVIPEYLWSIVCGILLGLAIAVWLFYYRREKGTSLWIPRDFAEYLTNRTKSTKTIAEAFGLGVSSVLGEILFIIGPLMIAVLALTKLSGPMQVAGVLIYTLISVAPLLIVLSLVGGGYSLSKIQKWREKNKYFLQFIAGLGLIIASFFVYANEIIGRFNMVVS